MEKCVCPEKNLEKYVCGEIGSKTLFSPSLIRL
jgi:hypothetical protein